MWKSCPRVIPAQQLMTPWEVQEGTPGPQVSATFGMGVNDREDHVKLSSPAPHHGNKKKKKIIGRKKGKREEEEVNLGRPWSLTHNRDHDHHNGTNHKVRPHNRGLQGTPW